MILGASNGDVFGIALNLSAELDFSLTRWHLADGDRDAEHMSS
jgi:hypothetical protein